MYVAMCMKEGYDAILNSVRGVKYARAIISFVVPLTVPLLVITLAQQASSISWFVIPFITATYFREYKITTTLGLLASLLLVASYNDGYISSLFVALIPLYAIQIKYIVGQYSSEPYVGTSSKLNGILILISQLVFGILHPLPISWLS
jgi:general stress protein CsbA